MDKVLAVLVLYKTSLEDSKTFISLTYSLKRAGSKLSILVYDNSPNPLKLLDTYSEWDIEYFHDPENPGISKAYNYGLKIAKQQGKEWLLLLDQDTVFPPSTITSYYHSIKALGKIRMAAPVLMANNKIISPFKTGLGKGKILNEIPKGIQGLNKVMPINSGMLVAVDDFEKCGGYNEDFAIDFSDFAFIKRFSSLHDKFSVIDISCIHEFAGFDSSDKNKSLERFKSYCEASLRYKKKVEPKMNLFKIIMFRALRLTLNYRSSNFIAVSLKTLLTK